MGVCIGGSASRGRVGQTPTAVFGTYPTGMHSLDSLGFFRKGSSMVNESSLSSTYPLRSVG